MKTILNTYHFITCCVYLHIGIDNNCLYKSTNKFLAPLPGIDCLFLKCEVNLDSAKPDLIYSIYWQIGACMRKDRSVVFQLDAEIERTVRRLRREQRNSKIASSMNNLQDAGNVNPHGPLQPVNIQEEQNDHANRR